MDKSKQMGDKDHRAVVLLSGGMDSTFAAYWARNHPKLDPTCAAFFNYGQKGAGFEWKAAKGVADRLQLQAYYYDVSALSPILSGGIVANRELPSDPRQKNEHGHAATFVPGRNLIHLALLSDLLYTTNIGHVVGGWNAVDVDYPDCSQAFLVAASAALTLALGREQPILLEAPAIRLTKDEIVQQGNVLGIPWEVTRSCYSDRYRPCGECDSCLVRARAFWINRLADPVYHSTGQWRKVVLRLVAQGYLDESLWQEKGE